MAEEEHPMMVEESITTPNIGANNDVLIPWSAELLFITAVTLTENRVRKFVKQLSTR